MTETQQDAPIAAAGVRSDTTFMTDVLAVIGYSGFAFVQPGGLNRIMPIQEVAAVLGELGRPESLRSTLLADRGSATDPDLTPAATQVAPAVAESRPPRANARVHIAEIGFLDE